jgi:hypothetical protein
MPALLLGFLPDRSVDMDLTWPPLLFVIGRICETHREEGVAYLLDALQGGLSLRGYDERLATVVRQSDWFIGHVKSGAIHALGLIAADSRVIDALTQSLNRESDATLRALIDRTLTEIRNKRDE